MLKIPNHHRYLSFCGPNVGDRNISRVVSFQSVKIRDVTTKDSCQRSRISDIGELPNQGKSAGQTASQGARMLSGDNSKDHTSSVITSAITGHERKSNHFAPARMSAPCASHCYTAFATRQLLMLEPSLYRAALSRSSMFRRKS